MIRSTARVIAFSLLVSGCTARTTRTGGLVVAGTGAVVLGGAAVSLVTGYTDEPSELWVAAGALIVIGALTGGIAHAFTEPSSVSDRSRANAGELTRDAQTAARDGRCDQVRSLEILVRALDAGTYETVFLRDAGIRRCLTR